MGLNNYDEWSGQDVPLKKPPHNVQLELHILEFHSPVNKCNIEAVLLDDGVLSRDRLHIERAVGNEEGQSSSRSLLRGFDEILQ